MTLKKKISGNAEGSIQSLFGNLNTDKFYDVEVSEHKDSRSHQHNKLYCALITEMASYLGHTTEEVHDLMRYKYLSFK